jgi:hypothetical protein
MDLDRLIHEKKHFAELEDADVELFLRERKFRAEHLSIEFKNAFPERPGGKYEIKKICKYVVGFSNEEGGLVIYGVADRIKDQAAKYEDYVTGLAKHPSTEDLSQWIKDRIHPLVASPAIRFFMTGKAKVAILKIPTGVNKPYCYYEPDTRALTFFKKTAGGVVELSPDEVRESYRTQVIEQSQLILRAREAQDYPTAPASKPRPSIEARHREAIPEQLEDPKDFGLVHIYCRPVGRIELSVSDLEAFLNSHRMDFSESTRYFRTIDVRQNSVSVGYFPTAVRKDVKSTSRVTLYRSGLVAFDALADTFLSGDKELHSGWLSYELQRHLQLTKALFAGSNVADIEVEVGFENVDAIRLVLIMDRFTARHAAYTGSHDPIVRKVSVDSIHDYNGDKRNIVIPVVKDIMDEVGRIFGLSRTPPNLWDSHGYLTYVKGVEAQR